MKKKNYLFIAAAVLLSFITVTQMGCRKNSTNPDDNNNNNTEKIIIPEETKEQTISATKGGTISFDNGLKLEVPANALNADTKITIQTLKPFSITDDKKSGTRLTGAAVSQIVKCTPNGTQFLQPVKLTIPYYPKLLPDGYSESDLLFLTTDDNVWDTLEIHIDQENNLAYAYINHFSTFKIVRRDHTNWIIYNLKLGQNNGNLLLGFKNFYGGNGFSFIGRLFKYMDADVIPQEMYYEIKLYRKKLIGKEFIASKQIFKGCVVSGDLSLSGYQLEKGPQAENKNYFVFDHLPKHANIEANSDLFVVKENNDPGVRYGAIDEVTFDKNENVVSTKFTNLKNTIPQYSDSCNFIAYSTNDGWDRYFEIAPLSMLEQGKKYFFLIKIRSYGYVTTHRFLGGLGEFRTSTFTLDDIGKPLSQNQLPDTPSNPTPQNGAEDVATNTTLHWSCIDADGDALKYDIYFGTSSNPPLFQSNHNSLSFNPGTLDENTTYYWKIKAIQVNDNESYSISPVWHFKTVGNSGGNTPVADFTATPTSGTAPLTVSFTNQSSNNPTGWQWDFGDGGTSTQQNPSHTYNSTGSYTVTLTATNNSGSDTKTKNNYITVNSGGGSTGTFTDPRDGHTYSTVTIGTQTWMAENLNYETENSWCYDNDPANCDVYGRLYDWNTIMNGAASSNNVPSGVQGICPDGWHIPSKAEWEILVNYLGGIDIAGGKMKETGTTHWEEPNTGATNESGYTGLPGGYLTLNGEYTGLGKYGFGWSSTEGPYNNRAWFLSLSYNSTVVYMNGDSYKANRLNVRCVKD